MSILSGLVLPGPLPEPLPEPLTEPADQQQVRPPGAGDPARISDPLDHAAVAAALQGEVLDRFNQLLAGLELYRDHPYRRTGARHRVVFEEGGSRLLDFSIDAGKPGIPVLLIPSLINRYYILDLDEGASFLTFLAENGFQPLVIDWGRPGPVEREFTLTDYIAGRLERLLQSACGHAGVARMPVIGYCMGGTLATALAVRRPDLVSGLIALATPWDFHAGEPGRAQTLARLMKPVMPMIDHWGDLPLDAIQALFTALQPLGVMRKFERFARLDQDSRAARSFVALEDWLNDGVPLAAPVARDCLLGWYGDNRPGRGTWRIAGLPVTPAEVTQPALHLIPGDDRIVPPESSEALARLTPNGDSLKPAIGHIGMMSSRRAGGTVWQPMADWLSKNAP
ncbi:MAG: alpha/beta fold hydrolase [Pseudomonadota bacterium]